MTVDRFMYPLVTKADRMLPFYIESIGDKLEQNHIIRPEGYPHYHWLHCVHGSGRFLIGGSEFLIDEGMAFLFNPHVSHEYYPVDEPWHTRWITFNGYAVCQVLDAMNINEWKVFRLPNMQSMDGFFERIYSALQTSDPYRNLQVSSLLYQFMVETANCTNMGSPDMSSHRYRQLIPVLSYIESNYHREITLEQLADILQVTPYHLCRLFKQVFNTRPFVYITGIRLKKAKELMLQSAGIPVKEIARMVGYNDTSYFCSQFREYEGMTPTQFKQMHG